MSPGPRLAAKKRKKMENKYHARKSGCLKGHPHRSGLEASVCDHLGLLEKSGELENIRSEFDEGYQTVEILPKMRYRVDFIAKDKKLGTDVYIEAKGFETAEFRRICQAWWSHGPGVLRIYKGRNRKLAITREISPNRRED